MKAPVLGLAFAAAAFAGGCLYLSQQLQLERERSAQIEATSRQLQARMAELEQARERRFHVRGANNNSSVSGAFGAGAPPPPGTAVASNAPNSEPGEPGWVVEPAHERPPAMEKMMRRQIRAELKRQYAGVGAALGLSKEKSSQLLDLLIDQQLATFNAFSEPLDPRELQRRGEDRQRQSEAAIQEFLGPDKAAALQEYQQSLPAREEFHMLVQQLEGSDVTLTPDQDKKLLAVYLAERNRVPMPEFDGRSDPAAFHKSYSDWHDDYSNRVAEEARHILDSSQLSAFDEVREWQKEMRAQFSRVAIAPGGNTTVGVAFARGGQSFSSPVAVTSGTPVTLVAPPPTGSAKKPND